MQINLVPLDIKNNFYMHEKTPSHSLQGKAHGSFTHLACWGFLLFVWVFLIYKDIREIFNILQDT